MSKPYPKQSSWKLTSASSEAILARAAKWLVAPRLDIIKADSASARYLRSRGIDGLTPAERLVLREFRCTLVHVEDFRQPITFTAFCGIIQRPDGGLLGVQCLALADDTGRPVVDTREPEDWGDKTEIKVRVTAGHMTGGAVRLRPPTDTLAIAEGIETAMSYSRITGAPCWAALSDSNLVHMRPPSGVKRFIVARDNDWAGERAARRVLVRIPEAGIHEPDEGCNDFNDMLREPVR